MKAILILLLIVICLFVGVLTYRNYYVNRELKKFIARKYNVLESLVNKLEKGYTVSIEDILGLAKDPSTRNVLFRILSDHKKADLFPEKYFTIEKAAESSLVNWLEYPTELNATPDEILLLKKITVQENEKEFDYFAYKFRVQKHWASSSGWMIGIAGPYFVNSLPYDLPLSTFSKFNMLDSVSPEEEAKWVHHNITMKKMS